MTTTKTISSTAKWNLQEQLPILIMFIIGVGGIVAGLTGTFVLGGAIFTALIGFGVGIWLIFENRKRKRRSTLHAIIPTSDNEDVTYDITVWMTRPIKEKWGEKMNAKVNFGNLSDTTQLMFQNIQDTRVLTFVLVNKQIHIPVRFLKDSKELRVFIADALANMENEPKYYKPQDRVELKNTLIGVETVAETKTDPNFTPEEFNKPVKKRKNTPTKIEKPDTSHSEEELEYSYEPIVSATPTVVQVTRTIGYEKYRKVTVDEAVGNAITQLDKKLDEEIAQKEREANHFFTANDFTLPEDNNTSIQLNFEKKTPKL